MYEVLVVAVAFPACILKLEQPRHQSTTSLYCHFPNYPHRGSEVIIFSFRLKATETHNAALKKEMNY